MPLKAWTAEYKGVLYGMKGDIIAPQPLKDLVQEWDGKEYYTSYKATLPVDASNPDPETVYVLCEELLWSDATLAQIKLWDYDPLPKPDDVRY